MSNLRKMIDDSTERLLRKVDEISIGNPADVISDEKEKNYKKEIERLQKQLDIAVKALYLLLTGQKTIRIGKSVELIETFALRKIEELDNEIHKQE